MTAMPIDTPSSECIASGSGGSGLRVLMPHRVVLNLYLTAIGRAFENNGCAVVYGPENLMESCGRYDIMVLHWPEELCRGYGSGSVEARTKRFLEALEGHRARGAKLLWIVNNLVPHEFRDSAVDRVAYQGVIDRCDLLVHYCNRSIEAIAATYRVPHGLAACVVDFGNFDGYTDVLSREASRARLGIPPNAFVFLAFGAIRGYKGFGVLLDAFRRARVPNKFLLAAGHYTGIGGARGKIESMRIELLRRVARNVRLDLASVPDEDVAGYLRAADVVTLSHTRGLNSGVPALAMTFGRMVIGPDIGCIGSVIAKGPNLLYEAGLAVALADAMETAARIDVADVGRRNAEIAATWQWSRIVAEILDAASHVQARPQSRVA